MLTFFKTWFKKKQDSVLVETEGQHRVDLIQSAMERLPQAECPLKHTFTPGLYVRECKFPKGALIVTKIHKSEHPFVISKGKVSVWIDGVGVVKLEAPYTGITYPGTRRLIYAHEDTIWTTFHPTKETDPDKIEAKIIEKRDVEFKLSEYIQSELTKELT